MNIQIFGTSKSFDTKKAERWFRERRIRFQSVDVKRYGLSRGGAEERLSSGGPEGHGRPQASGRSPDFLFGVGAGKAG